MTPITDKLAEALRNLRALYDTDEGCRSTPEYIAATEVLAAYASQQAEPSSGVSEPSDARVEAAAKALLARRELKFEDLTDKAREHYLEDARAVLQAADAVCAGVPEGFVLVPEKATPFIREALRIGMRREVPNDDLCDIRWRAAIAAAKDSEQKEGANG